MVGTNIDDPLVLEERILDLKYRNRKLEEELNLIKEASGFE